MNGGHKMTPAVKIVLLVGLFCLLDSTDAGGRGGGGYGGGSADEGGGGDLPWWVWWGIVAICLTAFTCMCAYGSDRNPCYAGMWVCCCVFPCLWVPFGALMCSFSKRR